MQRIVHAPDKPARLSRSRTKRLKQEETILCVGDSVPLGELLLRIRARRVTVEPVLAEAMQRCLEGNVVRLVVDLADCGPQAFSALAHLRLLRPELSIILVNWEEPDALERTALQGLPVVSVRRRLLLPEDPATVGRKPGSPRS